MAAISIQPPFPIFADTDGQPLDDGYIYIGVAGLDPITNPIATYWNPGLSQIAAQPLRTSGGYITNFGTPAVIYVDATDYSITVQDKNHGFVYNSPNVTSRVGGIEISGSIVSSDDITFIAAGAGAVIRTGTSKMRDWVSVIDYGAVGGGIIDNSVAFATALAAAPAVFVPPDPVGYLLGSGVTIPTGKTLFGLNSRILKTFSGDLFTMSTDSTLAGLIIDCLGVASTGDLIRVPNSAISQYIQNISCFHSNNPGRGIYVEKAGGGSMLVENFKSNTTTGKSIEIENALWSDGTNNSGRKFKDLKCTSLALGEGSNVSVFDSRDYPGTNPTTGLLVTMSSSGTTHNNFIDRCSNITVGSVYGDSHKITNNRTLGQTTLEPGVTDSIITGNSFPGATPFIDNSGSDTNLIQLKLRSYVPVATGLILNDGILQGQYSIQGNVCFYRIWFQFGNATSIPGIAPIGFSLPIKPNSFADTAAYDGVPFGNAILKDATANRHLLTAHLATNPSSSPYYIFFALDGSGEWEENSPITLAINDTLQVSGQYFIG